MAQCPSADMCVQANCEDPAGQSQLALSSAYHLLGKAASQAMHRDICHTLKVISGAPVSGAAGCVSGWEVCCSSGLLLVVGSGSAAATSAIVLAVQQDQQGYRYYLTHAQS